MAVNPLQLHFGLMSPALTSGQLRSATKLRIMVHALGHLGGKVWCGPSQASSGKGTEAEELQDMLWQQLFSDPAKWWDNIWSKPTSWHPNLKHKKSKVAMWLNNRHKQPARVDSQVPLWDAGREWPCKFSVEWQAHEGYPEVRICRKLCEDGQISDAVDALNLLVQQGWHLPSHLFYRVLKRCITHKDLVSGRCIDALAVESGYEGDAFLATQLIGLYASHGRLEEAMRVFFKVSAPNAYNWASIIFACARHGEAAQAIRLYKQMRESMVKADNHIYVAVLNACATAGDLVAGKEVHAHILATPGKPHVFVQTGLLDMYAKCRSLQDARRVFERLPHKDVVAWTAMIAGYAQQGMGQEALSLYDGMQQEGLSPPNSVTFVCLLQACASVGVGALHQGQQLHAQIEELKLQDDVVLGGSLVNMFAKCGSIGDARRVFDNLPERNVVTWTAMIAAYAQEGMCEEALSLHSSMQQEGIAPPNSVTFVCLLQACASLAALPLGEQLHSQIKERGMQAEEGVGKALVNMYAKCGSMVEAQRIFDSLPQRDIVAWGALIGGYTHKGDSEVVFELVDRMREEGIQPDGITFLSVLTVCSHTSLVDKGREYFKAMGTDYGISPTIEHYTRMMDLLGRAGHLDEALQMAKTMPFPSNGAVWLTILAACQKWNNLEIGQQAFEFAVTVDEKDATSYVLMSNIYAGAHMWEEAKQMEARRVKSKAWKQQGQSWWTDMAGVVHTFVVGDKKHSESEGIYARLQQMVPKMKKDGHVAHLESPWRDTQDEEKDAELHAGKLEVPEGAHY